jgi:hypothetical protein
MKRCISLQFLNPKTVGRAPWMGDLQTQTGIHALNGIRTHVPSVRASENSSWKTVHALDLAATMIGVEFIQRFNNLRD